MTEEFPWIAGPVSTLPVAPQYPNIFVRQTEPGFKLRVRTPQETLAHNDLRPVFMSLNETPDQGGARNMRPPVRNYV
jgi:hypothetical protein